MTIELKKLNVNFYLHRVLQFFNETSTNPRIQRIEPYTAMAAIALCKPRNYVVHTLMHIVRATNKGEPNGRRKKELKDM
jgi:hypothetical protein